MRTIEGCIRELKEKDPACALSAWWLRQLVKQGKIKHHKVGTKYLLDYDALLEYLANPPIDEPEPNYGQIRKVY